MCPSMPLLRVSLTVGVVSQDHAILADLSVSELLRQRQAQIPCPTLIMGALALVRGRGDVDFEAVHRLIVWYETIIGMGGDRSGQLVDTVPTVHPRPTSLYT